MSLCDDILFVMSDVLSSDVDMLLCACNVFTSSWIAFWWSVHVVMWWSYV